MTWNPEEDGTTHINIYSKGKTELGRFLSNWSPLPGNKPIATEEGEFRTVEGYWAWLGYENPPAHLREAIGYQAKSLILPPEERETDVSEHVFRRKIGGAIEDKLHKMPPHLREMFLTTELPFTHYYVYGGKARPAGFGWIIDTILRVREQMKGEGL